MTHDVQILGILATLLPLSGCVSKSEPVGPDPQPNYYVATKTRDQLQIEMLGEPLDLRWPDKVEMVNDSFLGLSLRITVKVDDLEMYSYYVSSPTDCKLAIYHQGHTGDARKYGADTIAALRNNGWSVLVHSMPLLGENTPLPGGSQKHNDMAGRNLPLRYFVWPVVESLTFAQSQKQWDEIRMIGISGGGWTTMLVSALDTRITSSWCIAGTWPKWLNDIHPGGRDLEQRLTEPDLLDLYTMPANAIHAFNTPDPCCFSGEWYDGYADMFPNIHAQILFNPSHTIAQGFIDQFVIQ